MAGRSDRRRLGRLLPLAALVVVACGGGGDAGAGEPDPGAAPPPAPASEAGALMSLEAFPAELDPGLAERGAELFQTKGCVACHTVGGGRLVGPDLAGVTDRREPGWLAAQILEPDSMIRNDPIARDLFAEYMTPMSDQGLTVEETRAVLEFLRRDADGGGQ